MMRRVLMACAVLLPHLASADAADSPPAVAPYTGPWNAATGFAFDLREQKTRRSVSGIACPANVPSKRTCLVVFDEGTQARYVTLSEGGFATDRERVPLRGSDSELDAEAAATDGRFYYVTGSHSAKRKTCENNPFSRHVIRFRVDPTTGRGMRERDGRLVGLQDSGRLWTVMAGVPGLDEHVGDNMCLGTEPPANAPDLAGQRGVNIEGLAVKDGRLFFGFRGPAGGGQAKILGVDANALFAGGDPHSSLTNLALGAGRGIRDLLTVSDGILVLAGPDDDNANSEVGWIVARWDGRETRDARSGVAEPLARLDLSRVPKRACDADIAKPEALAVLQDAPGQPYDLLVLSDGLCDGGPLGFRIPR